MKFSDEHPGYKGYVSDYCVNELPEGLDGPLQGFISHHCEGTQQLKSAINYIAGFIPTEPTQNWGHDYIVQDLSSYVSMLCKKPMHKVMDFFSSFYSKFEIDRDEFNEFLKEQNIGYLLEDRGYGAAWVLREDVSSRTEIVDETTQHVKDICNQTIEYLEQAKEHLLNANNERSRKDAVRDCLSAMETMLKKLSGENDIKTATKALIASGAWGLKPIVKDGLSLWNMMHELYPDMRHGNPISSNLSDEAAMFWLERITCYIRYVARMHKHNGHI